MMTKYMQVVWLYVIGILIIFFGLYMLMTNSDPMSFMVMLMGLAVSAIGSAHGRKMRAMDQFGMEGGMQEREPAQKQPEEPRAEDFIPEEAQPEESEESPRGDFAPRGQPMSEKISGIMGIFRKKSPGEPLSKRDILHIEMDDIKGGSIVPAEADVIELVCPKCLAENESQNLFCFSCGNRLRRMTPGEEASGEINLKIEPGAIEMIDDNRVAKVIICPKCNVANNVEDRFCWNCGKKIRSDSREIRKELENIIEKTGEIKPKKAKAVKKEHPETKDDTDFDNLFPNIKKKQKKKPEKK